jgi:hypothetical protein
VFGEMTSDEIELLTAYDRMQPLVKKELKAYLRYLLCKQYKKEVLNAVLHNPLLDNLIRNLLRLVDRNDFDIYQVKKRIRQIQELYFGVFEKVHHKYSEVIEELDSCELVRDFGKNSFANMFLAIDTENRVLIRAEVAEFFDGYNRLLRRKDSRKIIAV